MRMLIARLLIPAAALLAGVASGGSFETTRHGKQILYEVTDLSSLGGTSSGGSSINNRGRVAGVSNLPGDETAHAVLWRDGSMTDLGTLGGPDSNSSVVWPGQNDRGMIVGITETATLDPWEERWSCSFFFPSVTGEICVGFVWEKGEMKPLPTPGGNHGFATGVNNRGQIVGWAENTVQDPTCNLPQVFQFRAVIWGPDEDQIEELPPLPGDTVSAATAINDRGLVVGISGICSNAVGGFSARHAVLWERGTVTEIDNLGGIAWHTPMAINQRGDVVGFSNPSPDEDGSFNVNAFIWTERDGIDGLDTLTGDATSQALGINARRQVVGLSRGADGDTAFIWQNDVMTDLNEIVEPGYDGHLEIAADINERGEITGVAFYEDTGERVTFVATPKRGHGRK